MKYEFCKDMHKPMHHDHAEFMRRIETHYIVDIAGERLEGGRCRSCKSDVCFHGGAK